MTADHVRPKSWYESLRQQTHFVYDPAQEAAVDQLDDWWAELMAFKAKRDRLFGHTLFNPSAPKGMYLWGGVGRGKTFLMDAFYACVPYRRKRRVHFHAFMMEAHQAMQRLAQEKDPLLSFAREVCQHTRLLCLDELHVDNIADAMILGRLFSALFDGGVILMTTSNYPPEGLYPNGLQRQNFLPAIDLLRRELTVLNVDSGNDHRMRDGLRAPLYLMPDDTTSERRLLTMFPELAGDALTSNQPVEILGRYIATRRWTDDVAWFDFAELCDRPLGQPEFVRLAERFPTMLISHVPKMSADDAAKARRFTWLIDVCYDCRVKLILSAACEPQALYTDGLQASEFVRTVSRVVEMQTQHYLAQSHRSASVVPPDR